MAFRDLRAQMFAFAFLITEVVHLKPNNCCSYSQVVEVLCLTDWVKRSDCYCWKSRRQMRIKCELSACIHNYFYKDYHSFTLDINADVIFRLFSYLLPAWMIFDCSSFLETNYMLYYTSKQAPIWQGFGGVCERWPADPLPVCTSFEARGGELDAEDTLFIYGIKLHELHYKLILHVKPTTLLGWKHAGS